MPWIWGRGKQGIPEIIRHGEFYIAESFYKPGQYQEYARTRLSDELRNRRGGGEQPSQARDWHQTTKAFVRDEHTAILYNMDGLEASMAEGHTGCGWIGSSEDTRSITTMKRHYSRCTSSSPSGGKHGQDVHALLGRFWSS